MNRGVIIILGAPGSGKTTQGIMLSEKLNMQHISWGKLLRSPKFHQEEPELYKAIIDKETPNSERAVLIAKALHLQLDQFLSRDSEKSIVMDGYPRRLEEAKELMSLLHHHDLSIRALVLLNASLESIKYRIQNRLVCMQCGRKYDPSNYREQPSKCPYDFNPIVREPYDAEEVKKDYEEYINEVLPAYEYLKTYSESFFSVDGDDEDIVVSSNILINLHSYSKENSQIYVRQSFAKLPTKFGEFKIVVYQNRIDYSFHLAIVKGSVEGKQNVLSRVHSSCMTGDIFGSVKCDCGPQLHAAMNQISNKGEGIIFYLLQEGRGINIINKIQAYGLQDTGLDTVEANEKLGFPAEMRSYEAVKDIAKDLGVKSLSLMTNNPDKVHKLTNVGIPIESVVPLEVPAVEENRKYMLTKKNKMKHILRGV